MIEQPRLGLLLDPGLGKTSIVLEAYRRLCDQLDATSMLVVAPLRPAYSVWPREVEKWDQFRGFRVRVLHAKSKVPETLHAPGDIFVINPEGLEWLSKQRWRWPEILVVDESTKFKRKSAKRSRALARILKHFSRRYILTGTPAPRSLLDLHGQAFILDDGAALGATKREYCERWFIPIEVSPRTYDWRLRRGAEKEIYSALGPLVVRMDARDHLDLPELVVVQCSVALPPSARELYQRLRQDLVVSLERGDVVALNAGVLTAKCRQVANGVVYLSDDGSVTRESRRWATVHRAKVDALLDLVEELSGQPLLIAYEYAHELQILRRALRARLRRDIPYIGGGVSAREGDRLEQRWNAGDLPVLLVHPQSAGHGLNLQRGGSHLAWFSLPWDLELYDQLVGRLWRQGQAASRVVVHHLVAENTVDAAVVQSLKQKARGQRELLDALRKHLAEAAAPREASRQHTVAAD